MIEKNLTKQRLASFCMAFKIGQQLSDCLTNGEERVRMIILVPSLTTICLWNSCTFLSLQESVLEEMIIPPIRPS